MRVLFWVSGILPSIGGVQTLAADLLPALEQRGYRHLVLTQHRGSDAAGETHYGDIPIHRFSFWNAWNNVERVTQLRQQIAQLKVSFAPDLIHIYALDPSNFFHHLTAHIQPAPLLVSLHGKFTPFAGRTLQDATWIAGCSQALLKAAEELAPGMLSRSSVIYNGRKQPSLISRPLCTDPPILLCIGRLAPEKGFDVALTAFAKIHDRFPSAKLIIAGDGPEQENLRRQITELRLAGHVQLMGWVTEDQVFTLLGDSTLVLVPSRREGFSLTAVEAALMARPVVATRIGGLPEVVVHEETGLLVQNEDGDALAQAISFLLEDTQAAVRMGENAQRRAHHKFRWDRYVDAYDALYRKLIAQKQLDSCDS